MANVGYILIPGSGGTAWRIATARGGAREVPAEAAATPGEIANALAAELSRQVDGYRGQGVLLALPSEWCLPATIAVADLPAARDRAALLYRLEEQLPLAAEQFTADFVRSGESAMAVAVAGERVEPLVEALEHAGILVQSIAPLAMLATQQVAADLAKPTATVLWEEDGAKLSVIAVRQGAPVAWSLVNAASANEEEQIKLATDLMDLGGTPSGEIDRRDGGALIRSAARLGEAVLAGKAAPWFEFRRDAIAAADPMRSLRPALNAALGAAAVLLIVLAVAMLWRGWRYDRLARDYEDQLTARFQEKFPGWAVPANVRAVVESEHRKLAARGTGALPPEARHSALRLMRDVLGNVGSDVRFAIDRMTINDTSIEIEGRVKSYEDVGPLVASARSAGLEVPTPQMRKTTDGAWSYAIRGSLPARGAGEK